MSFNHEPSFQAQPQYIPVQESYNQQSYTQQPQYQFAQTGYPAHSSQSYLVTVPPHFPTAPIELYHAPTQLSRQQKRNFRKAVAYRARHQKPE